MYQQYVNEARAAQHREECVREAATERALRAARPTAEPDAQPQAARPGLAGVVRDVVARGHARRPALHTR